MIKSWIIYVYQISYTKQNCLNACITINKNIIIADDDGINIVLIKFIHCFIHFDSFILISYRKFCSAKRNNFCLSYKRILNAYLVFVHVKYHELFSSFFYLMQIYIMIRPNNLKFEQQKTIFLKPVIFHFK